MDRKAIHKSMLHHSTITAQGEVNGMWVIETTAYDDDLIGYPAGTLVINPAPIGEDMGNTFTAENGKVYYDLASQSKFTKRV